MDILKCYLQMLVITTEGFYTNLENNSSHINIQISLLTIL